MNKIGVFFGSSAMLVLMLLFFGYGMRIGNPFLLAVPVMIPLVIWAISNPEILFLISIAIMKSTLVLPGFPGSLELYHVTLFVVTATLLVRTTLTKEGIRVDRFLLVIVALYVFIAFYTMLVRGIGFLATGGGQAGGMRYILIYLSLLNLWLLPNLRVSPKTLNRALILFAALSFLPVVAEGVLLTSGGAIYHHFYFVKPDFGLGAALMGVMEGGQKVRYMSAGILGQGLIYLPLFLIPFSMKNLPKYIPFLVVGVVCVGFSGFRSFLIETGIFLFITGYLLLRKYRAAYIFSFALAGIAGYMLVFLTFDSLPFSIQRTFSFLPYVGQGSVALLDGLGTMNFRLQVWDLAWRQVPEYLWLGRGLAFDYSERLLLEAYYRLPDMIFLRGLISNLHNGPLELLVYLGLPAAILFFVFLGRVAYLAIRYLGMISHTGKNYQIAVYFTAAILSTELMFLLTFGSPYSTFYSISLHISMLRILQLSYTDSIEAESTVETVASMDATPVHV